MKRTIKPKKCKECGIDFIPQFNAVGQKCCSPACAIQMMEKKRIRDHAKVHAKRIKARREQLKTPREWAMKAQHRVNHYVRLRDWYQPCISCGRPHDGLHARHASHYRSVKAAKQLRFNLHNIHAACAQCNVHDSGNLIEYRKALVMLKGQDYVDELENNNELAKHDIEYYKRIADIFGRKARKLERRIRECTL